MRIARWIDSYEIAVIVNQALSSLLVLVVMGNVSIEFHTFLNRKWEGTIVRED